ncbi:hypothetical protein GCM10020000_82860 [Streptomyces olivoverticillatus]
MAAAAQVAYPCGEFGGSEGFDEVVVGAVFEARHPVAHRVQGGQQQYGKGGTGLALGGEQGQSVTVRQHAIRDEAVVAVDGELDVGVGEIDGDVDGEAGLAQPRRDRRAEFGIVLQDQYAHHR